MDVVAFAACSGDEPLQAITIKRRELRPNDIDIEIRYCGICHSDIHIAQNDWGNTRYPCVPGHEIVGRVAAIGDSVENFAVGDTVAVGCIVDSCRRCTACVEGDEHECETGWTGTIGSVDRITGDPTFGGFSERIVVDSNFVLRVPDGLDPARAAPLLCAGITTYSPLRHWGIASGDTVGVVGLGGLGHLAVKFARAFGANVVVFTSSKSKIEDALELGAHSVVVTSDRDAMKSHRGTCDFILDTVSARHDLDIYLAMLSRKGVLCLVGAPAEGHVAPNVSLLLAHRKSVAGSMIGGIRETQEMLDFAAERSILADIEIIQPDKINEAFSRVLDGDIKYRFVVDFTGDSL